MKELRQINLRLPAIFPELNPQEVHVWQIPLVQPPETISYLRELLSVDEQTRADRFHFQKDQHQFIIARGVLRLLLEKYQDLPATDFTFRYGRYGKPALDHPRNSPPIYFNISHSHHLAAIAFSRAGELGIDLEHFREMRELMRIARRFFSRHEFTVLNSLPRADKIEGFFNCWTRKEAFIKADGVGLSHPLDAFTVTLKPGEPARLLWVQGDPHEASRWTLLGWKPAANYAAALAIRQTDLQVQKFSV